jgi:glyoxylase-like metal-dependent hydrolase (beta-lactamase superfamily II)
MVDVSRRNLVFSAATAGAAFGLSGPLALFGTRSAQAQKAPEAVKPFARFKVGEIEVTTIYDGIWEKAHDAGFIANASIEETKKALVAGGLTDAFVPIPFTITVVKIKGETIMFDAGTGAQLAPTAGKLADNMKAAGIDPASIKTIVLTHFHPDHIFGLMAKGTNAPIYPNAQIIAPSAEYKFWTDPGTIAKLPEARQGLAKRIQAVFPTWKNIKQFDGDVEVAPGIKAVASYGHTPGHTSYLMGSGSAQLIVLSDVTNIPELFAKNPGWHAAFDQDAAMAEASRRRMFDRVVADKAMVTGYHFGMPGAGTIAKDGSGYAFVPVKA